MPIEPYARKAVIVSTAKMVYAARAASPALPEPKRVSIHSEPVMTPDRLIHLPM